MRRHATAVLTRWILRYLRVDDSWGASVARDAARALASTVSTERAAKNARFNIVWFCSPPPTPFASWRGFAVGSHRAEHVVRANRGGRGGGARAQAIELNREIIASRSAGEILAIVEDRGESFDVVNVATAVNKLCKVARARDNLRRDPRYKRLLELVQKNANEMNPQGIANVLNALGKLDAAAAAMSQEGWNRLAEAAEWEAREMKPQDIANVLNALGKLDAAASAVSQEGWKQLAEAAEWEAREMKPQNIANVLNALSKLDAAVAAMSQEGWKQLAEAAEREAREMNPQNIANVLNALSKLDAAVAAMSQEG
jgi:Protein of unknown function (DUF1601).